MSDTFKLLEERGLSYEAKIHLCFLLLKTYNLGRKMKIVHFTFSKHSLNSPNEFHCPPDLTILNDFKKSYFSE